MKRAWPLLIVIVLAGCMPLYIPPVPNSENAMPNEVRVVAVERTPGNELAVTARGSESSGSTRNGLRRAGRCSVQHPCGLN